ncbi:lipocalin family protein [Chitinophaga lutea]
MKRYLSFLLTAFVMSCSSGNDNPAPVPAGAWRVSHFSERGSDETSDFSGYTFTFQDNGTALAVKAGVNRTGSWSISGNRFNIDFGAKTDANKPLGELTDDWVILSRSSTDIRLADDNTSSAELLTFTKN